MTEENQDLVVTPKEKANLTVAEIKANAAGIRQVMKDCMKKGQDYGTIPGCGKKPALFKSGAEKILSYFRIAVRPRIERTYDGEDIDIIAYVDLYSPAGFLIGTGVGEGTTKEEKYRWRAAVCDGEFNDTIETDRRLKWKKGYQSNPPYQVKQVKTNPADLYNTVIKMAKKRGQTDGTLTSTAASDLFTQDIEDMEEELRGVISEDGTAGEGNVAAKTPPAPVENITGVPDEAKLKEGSKNGKPWKKYGYRFGQYWFSIFPDSPAKKLNKTLLDKAMQKKTPVLVSYEAKGNYKTITDVQDAPKGGGKNGK